MDTGAVLALVDKRTRPRPRVGIVTAVNLATWAASVTFADGSTTTSIGWLASGYTPVVGDRVVVHPTASGWFVLGKATQAPAPVNAVTTLLKPVRNWTKNNPISGYDWTDPWPWWYQREGSGDPSQYVQQGLQPDQSGGGPGWEPKSWDEYASVLYHGNLPALTAGMTVYRLAIVLYREWDVPGAGSQPRPILRGHSYTTSSPPLVDVAPAWAASVGALALPPLAKGKRTTYILPSSWTLGLLSGAIAGIGFGTSATRDALTAGGNADNAYLEVLASDIVGAS